MAELYDEGLSKDRISENQYFAIEKIFVSILCGISLYCGNPKAFERRDEYRHNIAKSQMYSDKAINS